MEHWVIAERHVLQGECHVARQREIIAELEREGHDAAASIKLLQQFQEMQALHIADRDRLRKELGL